MTTKAEVELSMMNLTDEEKALTATMPDDVALGYLKAKRKDKGEPVYDNILGNIFKGFGRS